MIDQGEILNSLRSGARTVDWEVIYNSELPRILNYFLYRVCDRELAQDLTASTFERAWEARGQYNAGLASPAAWLLGISRNILREYFRKNRVIKNKLELIKENERVSVTLDIEQSLQLRQDKVLLQNILRELPEKENDLIALKYGAGLTNREIARLLGLSESNVGSILHRTVTSLRHKWDQRHG